MGRSQVAVRSPWLRTVTHHAPSRSIPLGRTTSLHQNLVEKGSHLRYSGRLVVKQQRVVVDAGEIDAAAVGDVAGDGGGLGFGEDVAAVAAQALLRPEEQHRTAQVREVQAH